MHRGQGLAPRSAPLDAGQPNEAARHPFGFPAAKTTDPFYLSPDWRALVAEIIRERGASCEDPACRFPGAPA